MAQPPEESQSGTAPTQVVNTVADANLIMLVEQIECDVFFKFKGEDGKTTEQGAHKFMLIARSDVFRTMLCGSFKEGNTKVVNIDDVDHDIFKEILRFIYSDRATVTYNNAYDIIMTAKKYFLPGLITQAATMLEKQLTVSTVCKILCWSIFFELEKLVVKCLEYIAQNTKEVFNTTEFNSMTQEGLCEILKKDDIKLESEVNMVEACIQWAKSKLPENSKQREGQNLPLRKSLGPGFVHIRFHTMTTFELMKEYEAQVLHNKEKLVFVSHVSGQDHTKEIEKLGYNMKPRRCKTSAVWTRFQKVVYNPEKWSYSGEADIICFRVDKPIEFHGVHVFGGYHPGETHTILVRIFNGMTKTWSAYSCGTIYSNGSVFPIPFLVDLSVALLPERTHKIEVKMLGPKTFYGEEGQRTRKCAKTKFNFISPEEKTRTTVARGQIPRIIFKPL